MGARKVDNLNTDTDLAAGLMLLARRLVHESVPILTLLIPLPEAPDLADLRPVLAIRQQRVAKHDSHGDLSTFEGDRAKARPSRCFRVPLRCRPARCSDSWRRLRMAHRDGPGCTPGDTP